MGYSDFLNIEFDSYMVPTNELERGDFRLLEVDHRVVLPTRTDIRVLVTSADVIHSWTVPSLGIKADAVPGRLNQLRFYVKYPGVFYGQCSEICGANHSFIPIVVEAVPLKNFIESIKTSTTLKTMELKFKLGEPFDETTPDGREVTAVCTLEGGKIVSVQKAKKEGQKSTKSIREMNGPDEMVYTMTIDGCDLVCVQKFKRV